MATSFITVSDKDFGGGIDAASPEDQVPQGYVEDLVNIDPNPYGQLEKRTGYQVYGGYLPLPVKTFKSFDDNGYLIEYELGEEVDLSNVKSTPITVYGTAETGINEFPKASGMISRYYPSFINRGVVVIPANSSVTKVITADVSRLTSPNIIVNAYTLSGEAFPITSTVINAASFSITVVLTNTTASSISVIVAYSQRDVVAGSVYSSGIITVPQLSVNPPLNVEYDCLTAGGTYPGFTQGPHIVKAYKVAGGNYTELVITFHQVIADGKVKVRVTDAGAAATIDVIVIVCKADSTIVGSTAAPLQLIDLPTNYPMLGSYRLSNGILIWIDPIQAEVDRDLKLIDVATSYTSTQPYYVGYVSNTTNNRIIAVDPIAADQVVSITSAIKLFVYGIPQSECIEGTEKEVTYLDNYKAEADEHLLCGNLGNLYKKAGLDITNPVLLAMNNDTFFSGFATSGKGPGFIDTTEYPVYYESNHFKFDGVSGGLARLSSVSYSGGLVTYTLSTPNLVEVGSPQDALLIVDRSLIHIQGCAHSRNDGDFIIKAKTVTSSTISISVSNPLVTSTDYDEVSCGGLIGILFSRSLMATGSPIVPFVVGDEVTSPIFGGGYYSIANVDFYSNQRWVTLGDMTEGIPTYGGFPLYIKRTGRVFAVSSNTLVRGDSILVSGDELQRYKVKYLLDSSLVFTVTSIIESTLTNLRTVTLDTSTNDTTAVLQVGQLITLTECGVYSGITQILSIEDDSTFTITPLGIDQTLVVASIRTGTVEFDREVTLTADPNNTTQLYIDGRWLPVVNPTNPENYLTYVDSPELPLRSTMARSSMFFINPADAMLKYDGTYITKAGLSNLQLTGFITTSDLNLTDTCYLPNPIYSSMTSDVDLIGAALGDVAKFKVGDYVIHKSLIYQISGIDTTTFRLSVIPPAPVDAVAGNCYLLNDYRYYARLEMTDRNNNLVIGNSFGHDDLAIRRYGTSHAVPAPVLKFILPPLNYLTDYTKIDLVIYRTTVGGIVYRELTRIPVGTTSTYITHVDTQADDELGGLDPLSLNPIYSADPPLTIREAPKAKYLTAVDNSLVLANITEPPRIDIQVKRRGIINDTALGTLTFLLRKLNTDSSTTSDLTNRQAFQRVAAATAVKAVTLTEGYAEFETNAVHNLIAGNWVYITNTVETSGLQLCGWFRITVVNSTVLFKVANPDITAAFITLAGADYTSIIGSAIADFGFVRAAAGVDVPVYVPSSGLDFAFDCVSHSMLASTSLEFVWIDRLSRAINAAQLGWARAYAGNSYKVGQLIIEGTVDTLEVVLPAFTSVMRIYGNEINQAASAEVPALVRIHPSRLQLSLTGFPETFDYREVIDVNSDDGQEITGVIPTFGTSAFGGSTKEKSLLVFKQNSVYLVDLVTKQYQRLETSNVGCSAPYSITACRDGIAFASKSGVYRVNEQRTLDYIGDKISGDWTVNVDRSRWEEVYAHQFADSKRYYVSYYKTDGSKEIAVFHYNRAEGQNISAGAWSYYTGINSNGFCNDSTSHYFCTTTGEVMKFTDLYRDDESAIAASATLRSMDFGDAGIRKVVKTIKLHFKRTIESLGTSVSAAFNMSTTFNVLDSLRLAYDAAVSNLHDLNNTKVEVVKFTPSTRKCSQLQVKVSNDTIDEPMILTAVDYVVGGLNSKGSTEAADTSRS